MIFMPDPRRARRLAAGLAGLLAMAAPAVAEGDRVGNLVHDARVALGRGDGIAAEAALRKAIAAGLPREAAAARMGEAYLDQGDLRKARQWLGPARFSPADAAHGWRMLGRLNMAERQLPAAGQAFDRALALTPDDSRLWVDIARLRHVGGEHAEAVIAADRAVRLDPANPRALELRGLLVRDSFGPAAALPWFEAGLAARSDDLGLLGEYAATLGELGRARDMLTVTRRMIALDPRDRRAFVLQAMLAARAGDVALGRRLLELAGPTAHETPAGLLLSGTLELEAGNNHLAVDLFERLLQRQPGNASARLLLARAMAAAGSDEELIARFAADVGAPGASPYLLTLLARAYENTGRRDLAATLLDRAAAPVEAPVRPEGGRASGAVPGMAQVRDLALSGNLAAAAAAADRLARVMPGNADVRTLLGDLAYLQGDMPRALDAYRSAAALRFTAPLLLRGISAAERSGNAAAARAMLAVWRAGSPRDALGLRLEAGLAARLGAWDHAAVALDHLALRGLGRDPRVMADLALASTRSGRRERARQAATTARNLQPLSPTATLAVALTLEGDASRRDLAGRFMANARLLAGPGMAGNPAR